MNGEEIARIDSADGFAFIQYDESARPLLTTRVEWKCDANKTYYLDEHNVHILENLRKDVCATVDLLDQRTSYFAAYQEYGGHPGFGEMQSWEDSNFEDFMLQIAQNDIGLYLHIILTHLKRRMLKSEIEALSWNIKTEKKHTTEQFDSMLTDFFKSQRFTLDKHEQYKHQIAERLILAQDEIYELILKLRKA